MSQFKDHFSTVAADYLKYRPTYPKALFDYLASLCREHNLAWDAATGNGQTAHSLVHDFAHVIATDGSAAQITHAPPHPKITYKIMLSEKTDFPDKYFDLVTASAALHWFDFDTFYPELKRVLKPDGVFAAWCYNCARINTTIDQHIEDLYWKVRDVWPKERAYIDEGYKTIPFPLEEIAAPKFNLHINWNFAEMFGYLNTWSGVKCHLEKFGATALDDTWQKIYAAWDNPKEKRQVAWDLHLRVGKT